MTHKCYINALCNIERAGDNIHYVYAATAGRALLLCILLLALISTTITVNQYLASTVNQKGLDDRQTERQTGRQTDEATVQVLLVL